MNYAVLFAGGVGKRMYTSNIPKQFIEIEGKAIIIHAILCFEDSENIDGICVVCLPEWLDRLKGMIEAENIQKVKWLVSGGATGQESIYKGLKAIYDDSEAPEKDIVLISDGVRPFVDKDVIDKNIACVKKMGSSVVICPVPETIGLVDDSGELTDIPKRSLCYLLKAPQGFFLSELMEAHQKAIAENRFDCTNSAELMWRYGHSLYTVPDSDANIKVTTPTDLVIMQGIIDSHQKEDDSSEKRGL